MAPSVKVGNWLQSDENTDANGSKAEAYESGSESESEASTSAITAKPKVTAPIQSNGKAVDEDEEEEASVRPAAAVAAQEVVDWDEVMGRCKRAVGDASAKRRQAFIQKYLGVSEDCKSHCVSVWKVQVVDWQ
jgi:hypothetical protein